MKRRFSILGLASAVLFSLASCSLEEEAAYSLNSDIVYTNQDATEAVLMQAYGNLALSSLYGQFIHEISVADGFSWAKTDGDRRERTVGFNSYSEDGLISGVWQGFYKVIAESNYLIDGLEGSNLSDDYKNRGVAHARFLRGFAYFKLANLFGQSIVITEPIATHNLHSPLNDRQEVYNQAIEDLEFAAENLPQAEGMVGLATKDAALAYLAKLYWLLGNHAQENGENATEYYTLAKSYGDQVIGNFSLESNYENLWGHNIGNSPESIFQINFTLAEGVQNRSTFNFGPNTGWGGFAAGSPSWGNYRVDRAFYDLHRGTYPDDPRMESTYMSQWLNNTNGNMQYSYPLLSYNDWSTGELVPVLYDMYADAPRTQEDTPTNPDYDYDALPAQVTELWQSTYNWDRNLWPFNKKMTDPQASNNYDPKNLMIFRYADLLLLMADVENELGNTSQALTYVNQVLTRARESGETSEFPRDITSASQEELRDIIFYERLFELAGETTNYTDIRRRGTEYLKEVIAIHNNSKSVQYRHQFEVDNGVGGQFRDYIVNNKDLSQEFLEKNLLLPIPASEINTNEEVAPEDQNFGY